MYYIEGLLFALGITIGILSAVSDIKKSIIKNKLLFFGAIVEVILDVIYYVFFVPDIWLDFVLNLLIVSVISILLYAFHIWGGGDAKLLIILSLCYPARLYFYLNSEMFPLMYVLIFIFSIGYLYLLVESCILFFSEKRDNKNRLNKSIIIRFFKSYLIGLIYVFTIYQVLDFFVPSFVVANNVLLLFINFFVIILLSQSKFFSKLRFLWIPAVIFVVFSILNRYEFGWQSIAFNLITVILLMLLQRFFEKYNYKTISVTDLKPGMILSYSAVIPFELSRVQGLPHSTTEDLRSKINQDECDSIKRWAETCKGSSSIQIVKKIPFAIFILAGFMLFGILGCLG